MTNPGKGRKTVGFGLVAALIALVAIVVTGCGSSSNSSSSSSGGGTLDVVGYSTPESVYQESLEPGFQATPAGSGVSFSNSFGASGDQSRAVAAGPPPPAVHLRQAGGLRAQVEAGQSTERGG